MHNYWATIAGNYKVKHGLKGLQNHGLISARPGRRRNLHYVMAWSKPNLKQSM
jgi:hypothetical protein